MKKTIKIIKLAIFATVVMSLKKTKRIERDATPKIATQGVWYRECTLERPPGREPECAMP